MKTKLLTSILFMIASVFYSCSKVTDDNTPGSNTPVNNTALSTSQRRFIISNCSSHSGCHAGAKVNTSVSINEATLELRNAVNPNHNLSICQRSKLQVWVDSEVKQ